MSRTDGSSTVSVITTECTMEKHLHAQASLFFSSCIQYPLPSAFRKKRSKTNDLVSSTGSIILQLCKSAEKKTSLDTKSWPWQDLHQRLLPPKHHQSPYTVAPRWLLMPAPRPAQSHCPRAPCPQVSPAASPLGWVCAWPPDTSPFLPNPSCTACKGELRCQGTAPRMG